MSKKRPIITAESVIPGKLYLCMKNVGGGMRELRPCEVVCTDQPGWLRGYVKIEDYEYRQAHAFVRFIEDGTEVAVPVYLSPVRSDSVWKFCVTDAYSSPTLVDLPETWINEHIRTIDAKAAALRAELELMDKLKQTYLNLQTTIDNNAHAS